jgi:LytS/YehU family sensor histidine kinase
MAELEMQALKAQINPHFVFNCLNSIKGFIYDKNYGQADKYLDKFSELLRSTMDNADAAIISLEEEIKYLDTYLQLEKLRFGDKFDYEINAETVINKEKTFVPAMLLQPYVENAIRHGVRFLENKKGKINILAKKEDDYLVCEIDDNGIGREKATELKSSMHIEYQSRGMQLSRRRAELYNIRQEIIDKKDEAGIASGTKIIISIPLELKP